MLTVDGVTPGRISFPESIEDLSQVIAAEKGTVVPMGAGTQLEFGNPLQGADCVVSLSKLNRITTYNPAELTIHVEAGVTLAAIQAALAENKQALPLDPWNGPTATIGGITATNAQGPLRGTGSIRDWIIGMTVIHADGKSSKTGGRVVKNVTGYDLAKLYTGSLGSLVVVAEISFKLRPRFERTATAIAEFSSLAEAAAVLTAIRKSPSQPIACELVGPQHALWVRFGEHPRAVDAQIAQLPPASWKVVEGAEEDAAWEKLRGVYTAMGPIVLRVVGRPTDISGILDSYKPASWIAHALNGIVLMAVNDGATVEIVRKSYPSVVERAPLEVRRCVPTFGVKGTAKRLMLDMKRTFDPERRLNPGRHIDGE
jgi:glycolate oxidase FAD binding subunit